MLLMTRANYELCKFKKMLEWIRTKCIKGKNIFAKVVRDFLRLNLINNCKLLKMRSFRHSRPSHADDLQNRTNL